MIKMEKYNSDYCDHKVHTKLKGKFYRTSYMFGYTLWQCILDSKGTTWEKSGGSRNENAKIDVYKKEHDMNMI